MALFQNTILNKYLNTLDSKVIDEAYQRFCTYFHDAERQKNILSSKEEQFQEGFLNALFVGILGYTLNPEPGYNLITEKKDTKGSKKADAAILQDDDVVAVVELKDHKTPDLDKVERQAFGYKNQHKKATYVVISNFQRLRFYIDNAVEHIEWNLFTLTRNEFAILWLCLSKESLMRGVPKTIKNESVSNEEQITNKLYKDYIAFKRELFGDILKRNTTEEGEHSTPEWKILLFKKTQKLLDRMLFIFFAEDCGLLPPNSIKAIIDQWRMLIEADEDIRLYNRIKKYFGYMNTGYQGKKYEVFAYNGGLFKPDEVLDSLEIDDELLALHTLRLSEYDFASDVDVNILGHIFENSLNEIEEVTAQLENGEAPAVSKRKKDGVFYTPQYITKYIVENTVGRLCNEKKLALGIDELEYYSDSKRSNKDRKRMLDALTTYREWLLQITICDPACGSGAFLNAALHFLMDEHHRLDEMEANVTGSTIVFPGIENSILENNLFGVDINEESVEIARLALWLRTAKPHRKLSSLNNNIKCGNSLISDPTVAGDKAFDWEKEFPQVYAKGGFDIVIGNPPYVLCQPSNTNEITLELYKTFEVASYKIDLFHLFFEKGISLLTKSGYLGYITPNTYLSNTYMVKLRDFLLNYKIETLTQHEKGVFVDASVDVATITVRKTQCDECNVEFFTMDTIGNTELKNNIKQSQWRSAQDHMFNTNVEFTLNVDKCESLGNIASVTFGLQTKDKSTYVKDFPAEEDWEFCYTGRDVSRYHLSCASLYFKNNPAEVKAGGSWDMNVHHSKKIVVRQIGAPEPIFAYDIHAYATLNTMYSIKLNDDSYSYYYLLAVLCSKLVKHWWLSKYSDNKDLFPKIKGGHLKTIPIPAIPIDDQQPLINLAEKMTTLTSDLQKLRSRFHRRMKENLGIAKITTVLETFEELTFEEFIKELKKQKVKLTLVQQDEWEDYFNQYKTECEAKRETIRTTDAEIDHLVYALYGLTEEEIAIVEG